jgi:hypothetical protein
MTLHHYTQHSYNFIAPETFIGVEDTKNKGFCTNGEIDISKHVLCVNGVVFEKRISPTLRMLKMFMPIERKQKR